MKRYRILITGSRYMRDVTPVAEAFMELYGSGAGCRQESVTLNQITIVHGAGPGEPGCDALVHAFFRKEFPQVEVERHPAVPDHGQWPSAGPIRNSHMVSLGADVCLAFPCPRSRGTRDCYEKAIRAGIPTRVLLVKP